jgi:hypothetical protein
MAALPDSDLSDIKDPKTPREMFQKILTLIEHDQEDRAEDREMLESFISTQKAHNEMIEARIRTIEGCDQRRDEKVDQLEKKVNTWNITNTLAAIGAFITAIVFKGGSN